MSAALLHNGEDAVAFIVRVMIILVSFVIVAASIVKYRATRVRSYVLPGLTGAAWATLYLFSGNAEKLRSGEAYAPDVVRPLILFTLCLVLIWTLTRRR